MGGKAKQPKSGEKKKTRLDSAGKKGSFVGFSAYATASTTSLTSSNPASAAAQASAAGGTTGNNSTSSQSGGAAAPSAGVARPSAVYTGQDTQLVSIFQKLKKKDPITKTKALESLRQYAFDNAAASMSGSDQQPHRDDERRRKQQHQPLCSKPLIKYDVIVALNHFCFLFHNTHSPPGTCLAYDNAFSVRAGALRCWLGAMEVVPKAVRALLLHGSTGGGGLQGGNAMGVIWCLCSDPIREVSLAAKSVVGGMLRDCIPLTEDGGGRNLNAVRGAVISHLNHAIVLSRRGAAAAAGLRGNSGGSGGGAEEEEENEEERYERIIVSALDGASRLVERFPEKKSGRGDSEEAGGSGPKADGNEEGSGKDVETESTFSYVGAFTVGVIWKHIGSQRGSFRRGTYRLISAVAQHAPSVFLTNTNIRALFCAAFSSEKDPANHQFMFEALLLYLSAIPLQGSSVPTDDSSGEQMDDEEWCSSLCKSICKQLRRACYGSPGSLWCPLILPLLASLPLARRTGGGGVADAKGVREEAKSAASPSAPMFLYFQCQLLSNLWEGRNVAVNVTDQMAIATALSEGSAYLLLQTTRNGTGAGHGDDEERDESNVLAVADLFVSALRWYIRSSDFTPPERGATNDSSEFEAYLKNLVRDLRKLDEACQGSTGRESLIRRHRDTLWSKVRRILSSDSSDITMSDKAGIQAAWNDQCAKKLTRLVWTLFKATDPSSSLNVMKLRPKSDELPGLKASMNASHLVPGLRDNFFSILNDCRRRVNSIPTYSELQLLVVVLAFCGVIEVFNDCRSLESDKASGPIDGSGIVAAAGAATAMETFCMNDLLRWTVVLGSSTDVIDVTTTATRDVMLHSCFVLLRQCIEVLQSPLRQKQLWEAFLRELIESKCHVGVFAMGLDVLLSSSVLVGHDELRTNDGEVSAISEIIPCFTLENFAIDVGTAAGALRVGEGGKQDMARSKREDEPDSHEDHTSIEHHESELLGFLRVCTGLSSPGGTALVGHNVIQKWFDTCLTSGESTGSKHGTEIEVSGSNILLQTLLSISLKRTSTLNESDLVRLSLEAWRRGGSVWDLDTCDRLLGGASLETNEELLSVREQVLATASDSLKNELVEMMHLESGKKPNSKNHATLRWAQMAWRLAKLSETASDENRAAVTSFDSHSMEPLALIGLGDVEDWKARRLRGSDDERSRLESCWMCSCLLAFLDLVKDDVTKRAVLLGRRGEYEAARFVEILLSCVVSGREQLSLAGSNNARSLINCLGGKNGIGYVFLELCCEQTVQQISDMTNKCLAHVSACDAQASGHIGAEIHVLDLLVGCLLDRVVQPADERADGEVDAHDIREGDTLWYVTDNTESGAKHLLVSVVQVHRDDYPNLYFTVREHESAKERQTIASRLKKYSSHGFNADRKVINENEMEGCNAEMSQKIEALIVNQLVKPFFEKVRLASLTSIADELKFVEPLAEALNIVISRCGLRGGVGVGSTRYEVFQLVASFEKRAVDCIKGRNFTSVLAESSDAEDDYTMDTGYGSLGFEMAMSCFALAMGGGRATESSFFNFEILRYHPSDSISAVVDLYEDDQWLQKHQMASDRETLEGGNHLLNIHSATLMWAAVVIRVLKDRPALCRFAPALDAIIGRVSALAKDRANDVNENLVDSLLVLGAVCSIQAQARTVPGIQVSDLSIPSSSELLWFFINIWNGNNEKGDVVCWNALFLSYVRTAYETKGFLVRASDYADGLCTTLLCRSKRWFAYQLLHMIARECSSFESNECLSPPTVKLLHLWMKGLPEGEAEELEEDVKMAAKCLPRALMDEVAGQSELVKTQSESTTHTTPETADMGKLLSWLVLLDFLDGSSHCDARNRGAIITLIQQTRAGRTILDVAVQYAPLGNQKVNTGIEDNWRSCANIDSDPSKMTLPNLALLVIFRTSHALPTLVKSWWNEDCYRVDQSRVKQFIENQVLPETLRRELERIKAATNHGDMIVSGSCVSREVVATYVQDECKLSVFIRIPASFPLRNVEVDCHKTLGIPEKRWRMWALQIMMMINNQDGSILDALMLWKENVDKEFDGVEPCPVCYSVLCVKTHTMPNLECRTCNNRFHSSCLYKWFHSSGKSQCVLCQQPWSGTRV